MTRIADASARAADTRAITISTEGITVCIRNLMCALDENWRRRAVHHVREVGGFRERKVAALGRVRRAHREDSGPYGVGCFGDGTNLVTVEKCRSLYPECNDAEAETFTDVPQPDGTKKTFEYDRDCPCLDANGLNTGTITERAIIAAPTVLSYDASEWTCGSGVSCTQTVEKTLGYTDYVGSDSTTTTTTTTTDTTTTTTTTDTSTSGGASTKAMLATAGATIMAALLV